jgi:hypothetical protein
MLQRMGSSDCATEASIMDAELGVLRAAASSCCDMDLGSIPLRQKDFIYSIEAQQAASRMTNATVRTY